MTRPVLTAPEHIRGRMTAGTHRRLRAERAGWIKARRHEGETYAAIGRALGISHVAAWKALNESSASVGDVIRIILAAHPHVKAAMRESDQQQGAA